MKEEFLVPISETFHSIQGEGAFVGTPMHFIRVAGCAVGARASSEYIALNKSALPILANGERGSMCRTYDGRFFACDTDFHLKARLDVEELVYSTFENRICFTGGEPLAYIDKTWFKALRLLCEERNIKIHVETSGTVYDGGVFLDKNLFYVSCAPKKDFDPLAVERADEVRILVDFDFSYENLPTCIRHHRNVFLSAINEENTINIANVHKCLETLEQRPSWRLSVQLHKILGVR